MGLSEKIIKIVGIAAIFGMLVAPAMATTTLNDSLLSGNGYGPGYGDGHDGEGSTYGDGYGPGDCDSFGALAFRIDRSLLLARGGNGNGGNGNGGNGNGGGGNGNGYCRDHTGKQYLDANFCCFCLIVEAETPGLFNLFRSGLLCISRFHQVSARPR